MNPREAYFNKIYDMTKQGEDIVIVSPDLAAPSLDQFRRDFSERYISVGIAEQNLIQTATGLAMSGKKVIVWGLNPFLVTRALDQIRNTTSLMHIPFTMAGLHAGLSAAITGPTHIVITDISLIRTCAGVKCVIPSDCRTAELMAEKSVEGKEALYLRFDKDITTEQITNQDIDFHEGVRRIHKGKDSLAIVVSGIHAGIAIEMLPELQQDGIDPSIINLDTIPYNKKKLLEYLGEAEKIITIEEHILQGGIGSCVLETLADENVSNKKIIRLGIDIENGYPEWFGRRQDLQRYFGVDKESIRKEIIKVSGF